MSVELFYNSFHSEHLYLKLDAGEEDQVQASYFDRLLAEKGKPLQIGVFSNARGLIDLLKKAGFVLKRRCYEMDVGAGDLRFPLPDGSVELSEARKDTDQYAACAEMMYEYYSRTHAAVSPLTASLLDFTGMLPATALYSMTDGRISAAAFIEHHEIAYLCSKDHRVFPEFAQALLASMFRQHDRIVFEADDTDWAATRLRALFSTVDPVSYDTYVKCSGRPPCAEEQRRGLP